MKRILNAKSQGAIWSIIASLLFLASAQPSAYGLEFPMTTRLDFPEPTINLTVAPDLSVAQNVTPLVSELAEVAKMSALVERARSVAGAKYVAKTIMKDEYAWGEKQFSCLNRLWTKESHWNYKAHNYRSGAHGIAQALPATKMEIISTDWRTNPVTQIKWGLTYIADRYETPCGAWAKFKRSRYY